MEPNNKRNKLLRYLSVGFGVGVIVLVVLLLVRPDQIEVELFTVPSDSQVTMDGKPIKAGNTTIPEGKHTFIVSRQYFETATFEVDTKDLTAANTIYLPIYPNSPEGEAYLATHPDEQLRYERVGGAEFSEMQEKTYSLYPITADLPYQTPDFKIDYNITTEQTLIYLVSLYPVAATPGSDLYKQQLLQLQGEADAWLVSKGVDISKADIRYAPNPDEM